MPCVAHLKVDAIRRRLTCCLWYNSLKIQPAKETGYMHTFRIGLSLVTTILVTALMSMTAYAATYGGGDVQRYSAESPLSNGTIVQLAKGNEKAVTRASAESPDQMFGVVVDPSQFSLRITDSEVANEVHVSSSGTYNVLVSTQGGAIKSGDYVTLSSVSGVGMKASYDEPTVFGRAVGAFDGQGVTMGTTTVKDTAGKERQVTLGTVPVTINIQKNPNEKSTTSNLPEQLQRVGQEIAEKEVSPVRIYLSMFITAVSLIAAIAVVYSGVRSSVISIGRNPMSKKSIFRAMLEIILTSFLILIIGLFAVYLLLRL